MSDLYRTIESPSEAVFTEKRSKFLAYAYPVKTADDAKEIVAGLAKKYYDARHVCWAYMLGADRTEFRANDNGEPSGTAGKPILGQINSLELTDVLVAVVRYFGGIKLGTPGLIAAYRQASRDALDTAVIVERHVTADIKFTYPYAVINDVMKVGRAEGIEIIESVFDNACSMHLRIELDRLPTVRAKLNDIDGLTFDE
ncbi:MAG: YigZ family protein [Bacteroidales bacterium]|nr:YigZ family protein [Bacteroidales bacterium]